MKTLKNILFATDLWPASREVGEVAVKLASAFGSQIAILHVLEPVPLWPAALPACHERAAELLHEFAGLLGAQKVDVAESTIAVGAIADAIIRKAQEIDANLILIGAGELSRFDRYSMGPVAAAVVQHAPQPVLAIRPGGPEARFQKILCAVDHSAPAARGLQNAVRLTRAFGGKLIVLTVVPEGVPGIAGEASGQSADVQTQFESLWHGEFAKALAESDLADIDVTKEVRRGVAHREIITAAEEHQADLIVMGATGRTGLARLLIGGTTRCVLGHLPCSLLTVKQQDMVEELLEEDIRTIHRLMAEARELMAAASFDKAGAKYRQVLARNPFHIVAVEKLAEVHEKLGDDDHAQTYRRRAHTLRGE